MNVRLPHRVVRRAAIASVLGSLVAAVCLSRAPGVAVRASAALRPIDVNLAGAEELALLPGVGPSLARSIVEDRGARGPFRDLRDLDRVKGVGPGILARIGPHLRFPDAPGAARA